MEEILFHKGVERRTSIGLVLKGIYGGTVIGTGLTLAGALISPYLSVAIATATAVGTGFATTYLLQRAKQKTEARPKK